MPESAADLAELLAQVRRIEVRTRRMVSTLAAGAFRSAFKGTGLEFDEVREYAPGDDVRAIDWNVTARAGRPFVKVFREERELTILLLVDVSGSMRFGAIPGVSPRAKLALAAEAAAVVAITALKNRDRIGLVRFSERTDLHLPPRRGRSHALRLVREVLSAQPSLGPTGLAHVLDELTLVAKRRAVCFLVSDFLFADPAEEQRFADRLTRTSRRHDIIGLRIADPAEATLPGAGAPLALVDPETGAELTVSTGTRERAAYARAWRDARERTARRFRTAGCDLVELSTAQPAASALQRFFAQRRRSAHG
ncbi:hypothetical protein LBMAG53_19510 [Planctomycetota bacterium]|nr:hypothetical protein LBMAG53_19510 [Planctomycetota bacterium]